MAKKKSKSSNILIWIVIVFFSFVCLFVRKGFDSSRKQKIDSIPTSITEATKDFSTVKKVIGRPPEYSPGFISFELDIPSGWTLIDQINDVPAVIAKGDYRLSIGYPTEGLVCNFPDTEQFEGPADDLDVQSEFKAEFGLVRVGESKRAPGFFRLCQQEKGSDDWTIRLPIGAILYRAPPNPSQNIISEMNTVVKSIKLTSH